MIIRGLIILLLVALVPCNSLRCYECGCDHTNMTACFCDYVTNSDEPDYCVIAKERYTNETYVQLTRLGRNSTWVYVEDPYYLFTLQSIRHNETSNSWYTFQSGIAFACDWDLCNAPELIYQLSFAYSLSIDDAWLNTNILGTGSIDTCHDCDRELCGNSANPVNVSLCPMTTCTDSTTCLGYTYWEDLSTNQKCYESDCIPRSLDEDYVAYYGSRQRVEITAIVYLEKSRSNYDIWEVDVYCSVFNCTRSTIFEEVKSQITFQPGDFSPFPSVRPTTTQPPPTTTRPLANPLKCYSCECVGATACPCESTIEISADDTYCIVARENRGQKIVLNLGPLDYYASYNYILDAPFVVVEETISYDENGGFWLTTSDLVIYGCDWNLCNKPSLIPLLPNSFQMRLPESWLNTTILGSGQPVRNCHECPDLPECGSTDFLDPSRCPVRECNTTCYVQDTFNDPSFNFFCYQSYCLSYLEDQSELNHHRVEIEALVYASDPTTVNIWEIDLYCRGDDCSKPTIFNELRENLSVQSGSLAALFNETHDPDIKQLRCYNCDCFNDLTCACSKISMKSANNTYCIIIREDYGQDNWITMGHVSDDSSRIHIRDHPYLLLEESIYYSSSTGQWRTARNFVVYGCDWDLCNDPGLIPLLPNTFEMRLPETWLNATILGNGQPIQYCHECENDFQCGTTDFIDIGRCPVKECNTTCIVSDLYEDPEGDELCYSSYCAEYGPSETYLNNPRVEIEGILYFYKQPREIELWEIDVYCRAEDCSRPELFKEIEAELTLEIGDLSAFDEKLPSTTPATQPSTTPATQPSTTPATQPSTASTTTTTPSPPPSSASVFTGKSLVIMVAILMLLFSFH